ncbi:hypothetical protein GCM10023189_20380 [Nibrella saemangeumensis]|uniref:Uncharacterized protein n=1 Tax=Nibrella saemangeumensis TaxID=1084526 RepID=A0ABP8MSN6_9BACT
MLLSCGQTDSQTKHAGTPTIDTLIIDEDQLRKGSRFDPVLLPVSRQDVGQMTNAKGMFYTADTLAATDAFYLVLVGRLYAHESIGWLVPISRDSEEPLPEQMVYYDNDEGMSQTVTTWLNRQQKAIVRTTSIDEEGNNVYSQAIYTVLPTGTLTMSSDQI